MTVLARQPELDAPVVPPQEVACGFSRAAEQYDHYAVLQQPSAQQLKTLIPRAATGLWLDLGCGTAAVWPSLMAHAPHVRWCGVDLASGMLRLAQQRFPHHCFVQADATQLPLPTARIQGVFSNLMAQWLAPDDFLIEQKRVLAPGGHLVFSTLLNGSLHELCAAYSAANRPVPVNPQRYPQDYFQAIAGCGLRLQSWHSQPLTHEFDSLKAVFKSLQGTGAVSSTRGRTPGLQGRQWWQRMEQSYPKTAAGKYPLTFNIGYAVVSKPL